MSSNIQRFERVVEGVKELPQIKLYYGSQQIDSHYPVNFIQFWLRKGAHVTLYGVLGLVIFSTLGVLEMRRLRRWGITGLLVLLVAFLDEWNQLYVSGRYGQFLDVMVDMGGVAFFGILVSLYIYAKGIFKK